MRERPLAGGKRAKNINQETWFCNVTTTSAIKGRREGSYPQQRCTSTHNSSHILSGCCKELCPREPISAIAILRSLPWNGGARENTCNGPASKLVRNQGPQDRI